MDALYTLGFVDLTIPAWQMALYIGLFSLFMLRHETRGCLLTTYLFGLYWAYYLFGQEFVMSASGYPSVLATYITVGLLLVGFSVASIFYER